MKPLHRKKRQINSPSSRYSTSIVTVLMILLFVGWTGCGEPTGLQTTEGPQDSGPDNKTASKAQGSEDLPDYDPKTLAETAQQQQDYHLQAIRDLAKAAELDVAGKMTLAGHYFMSGQFEKSVQTYDEIIEMAPALKPRLWQRGLALYYADEFEKGVDQFETHQTVNSADVENSVWHLLCAANVSDVSTAREGMIEITGDRRIPMMEIYKLFRGELRPEDVVNAATTKGFVTNRRMQLYYAYLYLGLYFEMMGEPSQSTEYLKAAAANSSLPVDELMGQVARVHYQLREKRKSSATSSPPRTPNRPDHP